MMFLPPVNIPVSRLCYSSHFFRLTCYLSSSTYWSIRSLWARSTFVIFVLYRVQHCLCSHTLERCFSSLSVCSQILSHCSLSIQSRNLVLIRMTHLPFAEKRHQAKIFLFFVYFFQNNKNSLTKTSFSLFWLFTAEDEKTNKQPNKLKINKQNPQNGHVHFISSWLCSHPDPPSPPSFAGLTREYQGLLLCLWRGIQAIQWLVTR